MIAKPENSTPGLNKATWLLSLNWPVAQRTINAADMKELEPILELKNRMGKSIIGQDAVVERLLLALLANGQCPDGRPAR